MKELYLYNVSYFFKGGNGSSQIVRKCKINTLEDFREVSRFIENRNDLSNVAIINYQLICKIRADEALELS